MTSTQPAGCDLPIGSCQPCAKWIYASRKVARHASRHVTNGGRPRPYRCPDNPQHWHLGNLAPAVRRGHKTREEWYRPCP